MRAQRNAAAARAVARAGIWLAASALLLPSCDAPDPGDVVLVVIDTLRADRLGCTGHPEARTPVLDRLARGGALFREAVSHVPVTAPSTTSILTGTLPTQHGVRDNAFFSLGDEPPTLAEAMARTGRSTAAFVSAAVLDRSVGLDRGFAVALTNVPRVLDIFSPLTVRKPCTITRLGKV